MTRRAKLVVGTVLGAAFVALGLLPLLLLTLPNPQPMHLSTLDGERDGTYVDASSGYYKMFPFAEPATNFPPNVPVTSSRTAMYVRFRQMDSLDAYTVRSFSSGREVPVQKRVRSDRTLVLTPLAPLAPGRYAASAARDSMYGGTDYFYFRVAG